MANGGKDIKLGDDKRPVSIIPQNTDNLFNIANGELLTDEFGTPLITEVDQFFIPDTLARRSTSIVFPSKPQDPYTRVDHIGITTESNVVYGADLDVYVTTGVAQTGGGTVSFASTVLQSSGGVIPLELYPYNEVKTIADQGSERNRLYFDDSVGISTLVGVEVYDKVYGKYIPDGTYVANVNRSRLVLSNDATISGIHTNDISIVRSRRSIKLADNVFKVQEAFRESSEVSTTLLGIPRAETQLSLFSNVSSYGLDSNEFEFFNFTEGTSFGSWDTRANQVYGKRYQIQEKEEVQESAIRIESFPVPYSYPFGPKFARIGSYNPTLFNQYLTFIQLGNELYTYYDSGNGASQGYPADWKDQFLDPSVAYVDAGDVKYAAGIGPSFAAIDTWTDTWRDIKDSLLIDPTNGNVFGFAQINALGLQSAPFGSDTTRPGYNTGFRRFGFLQSRRVFRYQPGRISGFTFGLRSSTEPVSGITLEWGIKNPTDQYVFQIDAGQLKIIRRSTIPLPLSALKRSGLTNLDQVFKGSGDPFDDEEYWTIEIPRDKFNGDPLNGNGPSGYLIQPEKVTMYKIEFGWYGAIGARFYAYIPAGPGEARWVVIHTLVIENSMGSPCLEDSYFRLMYSLNVANTADIRTPQFLYKYGASYYIDGGDEGTTQIFSVDSGEKAINPNDQRSLVGITPKDLIVNSVGSEIVNKKLIIPTKLSVTSDSLAEVQVVTCKACPGFGHVYTPGVASTVTGREVEFEFTGGNTLASINDSFFKASDVGSKLIAPSIYNAYIVSVENPVGTAGSFESATIQGYGPGYDAYPNFTATRDFAPVETLDRVTGITTTVGIGTYPYAVRLSSQDAHLVASDFKFTGSKIEIQFTNPTSGDSYGKFADFIVGLTDLQPDVSLPDILNGFVKPGAGTTTIMPKSELLYGEYTHSYASFTENGVERGESYAPRLPARMAIDERIPRLGGSGAGHCSKVTFEVLDPSQITGLNQLDYLPGNPPPNGTTTDPQGRIFLLKQGTFPTGIDYAGGQVKLTAETAPSAARFVGDVRSYTDAQGNVFQFIQIDQSLGSPGSDFSIDIRPIRMTTNGNPLRQKLFNFDPFPLYFFAKLSDNATINNISIKETVGEFQRTISPKLFTLGANVEVTNAGGNADVTGAAPTNFDEVTRLSSALVDVQNQQRLRPGSTVDTIFLGANSTKEVDMSKIFGQDRNVITPDNNNIEATFLVAKKLDAGATGTVQATLNYKEQ